jgi:MFS superfamily sulfate permease-like transporter
MTVVRIVRWGLPLAIIAAGVYLVGRSAAGFAEAVIAAGVCVALANVMLRVSFADQRDRDREEAARAFYDEHGHWPDEPPPDEEAGG